MCNKRVAAKYVFAIGIRGEVCLDTHMARPPRNTSLSISLGQRIAQLIDESGKTQADVSFDLRLSAPMLSRWCSGAQVPSVENLIRIAEHFNASADWLLGLSGTRLHAPARARTVDEIVAMTDELAANPPPPRGRSTRQRS